jgi:hypothetical protein
LHVGVASTGCNESSQHQHHDFDTLLCPHSLWRLLGD